MGGLGWAKLSNDRPKAVGSRPPIPASLGCSGGSPSGSLGHKAAPAAARCPVPDRKPSSSPTGVGAERSATAACPLPLAHNGPDDGVSRSGEKIPGPDEGTWLA
jgi:hypothetical protein